MKWILFSDNLRVTDIIRRAVKSFEKETNEEYPLWITTCDLLIDWSRTLRMSQNIVYWSADSN